MSKTITIGEDYIFINKQGEQSLCRIYGSQDNLRYYAHEMNTGLEVIGTVRVRLDETGEQLIEIIEGTEENDAERQAIQNMEGGSNE